MSLSIGLQREDAVNPIYSYWQPVSSIGIGAELPWGFHVYFEPAVYWTLYDDERFAVKDNEYVKIVEKDFTHMYSLALSNNKFDLWGFVPTVTFGYTQRNSNIWQREFDKFSVSFKVYVPSSFSITPDRSDSGAGLTFRQMILIRSPTRVDFQVTISRIRRCRSASP